MEFLGFQSCMNFLLGCGVVISTFISDRHIQIASHMKNVLTNITQYFDLWHLKKSKRSIEHCNTFLFHLSKHIQGVHKFSSKGAPTGELLGRKLHLK